MNPDNEVLILRELGALHRKVDTLQATSTTLLTEVLHDKERSNRHARRLRKLEVASEKSPAVDYQSDRSEITGTHELAEIQQHIRERRDSGIWWKRQRWVWAMAAAGALALATLTGCATYLATHLH